jgi:hypothetical protein
VIMISIFWDIRPSHSARNYRSLDWVRSFPNVLFTPASLEWLSHRSRGFRRANGNTQLTLVFNHSFWAHWYVITGMISYLATRYLNYGRTSSQPSL